MIKFSVIVTTYNGEETIGDTLQSVLNQQGLGEDFGLEIIVIDDGSTDQTVEIVSQTPAILIQNEENSGGPNKGRNIGLEMASGDYICIVDQDDTWHTNRLEAILPYLDRAPVLTSGFTIADKLTGKTTTRVNHSEEGYILYPENATFFTRLLQKKNEQVTYMGSVVISSDLKNVLFEEDYGAVDFDWWLRLLEGRTSVEVCQSLYTRNIIGSNLSLDLDYRMKNYNQALKAIADLEKKYPNQTKIARKRINASMAKYFYIIDDMDNARKFFSKAELNLKNLLYYLTTFVGSEFVKKNFPVFGS